MGIGAAAVVMMGTVVAWALAAGTVAAATVVVTAVTAVLVVVLAVVFYVGGTTSAQTLSCHYQFSCVDRTLRSRLDRRRARGWSRRLTWDVCPTRRRWASQSSAPRVSESSIFSCELTSFAAPIASDEWC